MENRKLNMKIGDLISSMYLLSCRYSNFDDIEIRMEAACQLENGANILRILAERLATQTWEERHD